MGAAKDAATGGAVTAAETVDADLVADAPAPTSFTMHVVAPAHPEAADHEPRTRAGRAAVGAEIAQALAVATNLPIGASVGAGPAVVGVVRQGEADAGVVAVPLAHRALAAPVAALQGFEATAVGSALLTVAVAEPLDADLGAGAGTSGTTVVIVAGALAVDTPLTPGARVVARAAVAGNVELTADADARAVALTRRALTPALHAGFAAGARAIDRAGAAGLAGLTDTVPADLRRRRGRRGRRGRRLGGRGGSRRLGGRRGGGRRRRRRGRRLRGGRRRGAAENRVRRHAARAGAGAVEADRPEALATLPVELAGVAGLAAAPGLAVAVAGRGRRAAAEQPRPEGGEGAEEATPGLGRGERAGQSVEPP